MGGGRNGEGKRRQKVKLRARRHQGRQRLARVMKNGHVDKYVGGGTFVEAISLGIATFGKDISGLTV